MKDIAIYIDWLFSKTGKQYRLVEDQEWRSVINHVVFCSAPEGIDVQSFIIDENDLMLDSSSELLAPSIGSAFDSGFRVIRNIDPIDEEE